MSWLPYAGSGALLLAVVLLARRGARHGRRRRLRVTFDWTDDREDASDDTAR